MNNKIRIDLIGRYFGFWQVLEPLGYRAKNGNYYEKAIKLGDSFYWNCKCLGCGSIFAVRQKNLIKGISNSCWNCSMKKRDSAKLNASFLEKQTIKLSARNKEVLNLYSSGYSVAKIAKKFNLTTSSIYTIIRRAK